MHKEWKENNAINITLLHKAMGCPAYYIVCLLSFKKNQANTEEVLKWVTKMKDCGKETRGDVIQSD